MDVPVENNDRYTFGIYFLNDGGDGVCLVGGCDDDIKSLIHEIADVCNLLFIIVVRRPYLYSGLGMQHDFAVDFIVAFVAPVVRTAL